jgi:hypothetical protein
MWREDGEVKIRLLNSQNVNTSKQMFLNPFVKSVLIFWQHLKQVQVIRHNNWQITLFEKLKTHFHSIKHILYCDSLVLKSGKCVWQKFKRNTTQLSMFTHDLLYNYCSNLILDGPNQLDTMCTAGTGVFLNARYFKCNSLSESS